MKLHLPLALRAALLMTMAAFISPASMAEDVVISQNTDYVYDVDVYHRGSISFVGAGASPTYTLSFTATCNEYDKIESQALAVFGGEVLMSNIKTLSFNANSAHGSSYVPSTATTSSKHTMHSGGAICAGFAADVRQEENSPYAAKVSLIDNGAVLFLNNTASESGGAIALKNSELLVEGNSRVVYEGNSGQTGGAIIAHNSDVNFCRNDEVLFSGNIAAQDGGAIKIGGSTFAETSNLLFDGNKRIEFSGNISGKYGAAVYFGANLHDTTNAGAVFRNNINTDATKASISFVGNEACGSGGAIYSTESLQFLNNGNIEFISNSTTDALSSSGGAIYAQDSVFFDGNAGLLFQGNGSENAGGAAHVSGAFTLCNTTGVVNFYDNEAASDGGALNLTESAVKNISGNKQVVFEQNVAGGDGGAMDSEGELVISDNELLKFINNRSGRHGGALYKGKFYKLIAC